MYRVVDLTDMTAEMTRELNEIAASYQNKYTDFIDDLSQKYDSEFFWWDTPLSSRSVGCKCFEDVCKLILVLSMYHRGEVDEVITEEKHMKQAILANVDIIVHLKKEKKGVRQRILRNSYIQTCRTYQGIKKRIKAHRKNRFLRCSVPKKVETIIVSTYAIPSQLKDGVFNDRYFPGLQESLSRRILFFTHMVYADESEGEKLTSYLAGREDCAVSDCYSTVEDLKEVRRYIRWSNRFEIGTCGFDGIELSPLVSNALKVGAYSSNAMFGILKGNALCRMIDEQGLTVRRLIDWYEGQPSSNAMIRRLRKKHPEIETVAYIFSPCPENCLGISFSNAQIQKAIVPELAGIQGEIWKKSINRFSPLVRFVGVPSFRYANIGITRNDDNQRKGIIVVLPYVKKWGTQLLHDFFYAISNSKGMMVYIKNHPANASLRLVDYGISQDEYNNHMIEYANQSLADALIGKQYAVIAQSSSTLEVLLSGVNTIAYIPRGELSHLCVPHEIKNEIKTAYDGKDIQEYIMDSGCETGMRIKKSMFFNEINSDTMEVFT